MDTIKILQKARDFLAQPDRWCAYMREDSCGRSCAMGGLARAMGKNPSSNISENEDCHPAVLALVATIPSKAKAQAKAHWKDIPWKGRKVPMVTHYNNTTDQQTVVAWFDRAIANLREHPMEKI